MMARSSFVGRTAEAQLLKKLATFKQADLVTIVGRRRVGKTFLIKQLFKDNFDFYLTGIQIVEKEVMLKAFASKLKEYTKQKMPIAPPQDWMEAFELLKQYLKTKPKQKKKIVFLDEFPWLDNHKSGFLPAFEYFWNDWAVDQNIMLIICGSSTSWMYDNIMANKAGLHNRITQHINLAPFTLKETQQLIESKGIKWPYYQTLQVYMALGGIPYYLNEIHKGETAIQSIDRILFNDKSTLKNEFEHLFRALFDNYQKYELVIAALTKKHKGLTRQEIINETQITNGGGLTRILKDLELCSFIKTYQPFGKEKKEVLYRLEDEYALFYYKFRPDRKPKGTFMRLAETSSFKSWAGFAFEGICIKHIDAIKHALGISGVHTTQNSFYKKGTKAEEGFQIDMLIDRADQAINICEMKFYNAEYTLTKKEADKLRQRREQFRAKTKTKKYLINTLITTYGLIENEYSINTIDKTITIEKLFAL
jgi:uncharacterized protein